jgi:hypothetical protein
MEEEAEIKKAAEKKEAALVSVAQRELVALRASMNVANEDGEYGPDQRGWRESRRLTIEYTQAGEPFDPGRREYRSGIRSINGPLQGLIEIDHTLYWEPEHIDDNGFYWHPILRYTYNNLPVRWGEWGNRGWHQPGRPTLPCLPQTCLPQAPICVFDATLQPTERELEVVQKILDLDKERVKRVRKRQRDLEKDSSIDEPRSS